MLTLSLAYILVMVSLSLMLTASDAYEGGSFEDPISSICPNINKYLHAAYGCRPEDFRRHVACDDNRIDLRCPRSKQIAIHSASYGWSDRLTTDCPATRTYDSGCPRICALGYVIQQCQSKRRCVLDASEAGGSMAEPHRCRVPGVIKYLGVIYTCVKKSSLRHIESSSDGFVNPCDEDDLDDVELGQAPTPAPAMTFDIFGQPQTTTYNWYSHAQRSVIEAEQLIEAPGLSGQAPEDLRRTTLDWLRRPVLTQQRELRAGLVPSGSGGNSGRLRTAPPDLQRGQMSPGNRPPPPPPSPPSHPILVYSLMDWLWTWTYINENMEKFVLYMLLGLSLGTITILVSILFHLILCHRRSLSKDIPSSTSAPQAATATCSSPTWRMPESESSTGDDRTLHDDDVELTSFNHIDSLQRHVTYHPHQSTTPYRPASIVGVPQSPTASANATTTTTTATINRSYSQANPVVTRCCTPSPPELTLPPVSCAPNGGFAPNQQMIGNGRVEVTPLPQGHCVGSLGRTYSSHYRRDSYQLDPAPGCRTLQPMQHYYG